MLNSESSPTKPPAAATATVDVPSGPRKKSWIIGAACSRIPMPAVTLQKRTTHRNQNWGVLMALAAETSFSLTNVFFFRLFGSKPSGFQPGAGTRTLVTPTIMMNR